MMEVVMVRGSSVAGQRRLGHYHLIGGDTV